MPPKTGAFCPAMHPPSRAATVVAALAPGDRCISVGAFARVKHVGVGEPCVRKVGQVSMTRDERARASGSACVRARVRADAHAVHAMPPIFELCTARTSSSLS